MIDATNTRVAVCIPTMGDVNVETVSRLIRWAKQFEKGVVNFYFTYKVSPVDRARNQCVDWFLKQPLNLTHLFFVDADTVPPYDALEKLLSVDKDVVTGLTPMLQHDKEKDTWGTMYNAFKPVIYDDEGNPKTEVVDISGGIVPVHRFGGSCLLIKRKVFEKLERPYFKFELKDNGLDHVKSEDIYFADKARDAGFELWAHTGVMCGHYKQVRL